MLRQCRTPGRAGHLDRLHGRDAQQAGLERRPIRRAVPGSIEQQEFEYTRHGTVNIAFGHRYLKRGSWASREEYIAHVEASWPEYNQLYAHPFEWTWTNRKMRLWFAKHAP